MLTAASISQILVNGLTTGLFYVLMALGFTLIFGIMRLVNFAHGEFYMLGAFAVYHLYAQLGINFFLALLIAGILVGLFGVLVEKVLFAPIRTRELSMLMSALGLQIALQGVMAVIEGVEGLSLQPPVSGVFRSTWVTFPYDRLVVVVVALTVLGAFHLFLKRTRAGQALRAVAQDSEAALMQGIPVGRVYALAFLVGCFLAAIAGGVIGSVYSLHVYMGQVALLKAFVVVILGGLGSVPGALVGGLVLGFGESLFTTLFGGLVSDLMGFLMIMLILLWKPSGLLGRSRA